MEVLQAKNLKKIYGSGNNAVHALDGVDLSVKKGEFVAIVGTSGSGKSTLLHMLGGLDRPTSGTVMVDGQDIFSLKEEALTIFRRRKIGFVFQAYNLVPVLNVYENIVLPIELDGGKVNKDFVQQIVQTLGLDDRLDALPNQLPLGGLLNLNSLDNNAVCKRNDLHSSCPPIIKYNENFFGTFGPFLPGLRLFSTPFL